MKTLLLLVILVGGNSIDNVKPVSNDGIKQNNVSAIWDFSHGLYQYNYNEANDFVIGVSPVQEVGEDPPSIERIEYSLNGGPWTVSDKVIIRDWINDQFELRAAIYPRFGKPIILDSAHFMRYKSGNKYWCVYVTPNFNWHAYTSSK